MLKTMISAIVQAHRAFGKSLYFIRNTFVEGKGDTTNLGSFISAIKLGRVICPMKVYETFKKAFIPATKVVPATGKAV